MSGWGERAIAVGLAAGLICGALSGKSNAQDMLSTLGFPVPDRGTATTPAAAPANPAAASIPAAPPPSEAQFVNLVGPIALYPDPLLGQVLMASTYPHEVSEAARWLRVPADRALGGEALTAALKARGWNPSVMALVPFPSLLTTMAEKLDWTEQLGKAFLAQPGEVMAAVQRLRHAALAAGNLKVTPECHCVIQTTGDIISIQPSEGQMVSIPVYDPAVAFGALAEAAHSPVVFQLPAGIVFAPGTAVGFSSAIEVALFGPIWGWESIDWAKRRIVVDEERYKVLAPGHIGFDDNVWVREPPPPPHKIASKTQIVATRSVRHAKAKAKAKASRHLAVTPALPPPPLYGWQPQYRVWGLPPGAIVPPPPPRYIARNWYNGYYYDGYR
ncbi:MAG TPA: DUF3300 domain-containing protein [Stellaceae bacterium]|nr:DUF3300 domain-containing protein [Stellaceae bacterium]